jgi:uncharacterized protein YgbK (DUF1537 family)
MARRNGRILLGAIADDFTGATDLCNTLVAQGMRTVQVIGVPNTKAVPDADAVVVALKSRTIAASKAVRESRAALAWLQRQGARQIFFKYCSTFDSTSRGNIGPVADALLDELGGVFTIACPAFPTNGRTIYKGHLFVGDVLLEKSGMRNHPLTPMRESDLVKVLGMQTKHPVGLVPHDTVRKGAKAVRRAFDALESSGTRHAIVDAIADHDLNAIGAACADLPLITGGSGVAMGLPANFRKAGLLAATQQAAVLPAASGHAAVIAGSCSEATLGQIERMRATHPAFFVDAEQLASRKNVAAEALAWAAPKLADGPVLIYASAPPRRVKHVQKKFGVEKTGAMIERCLARVATGLVDAGVRRLVVAGGETAGAVVGALGVTTLRIGGEIDPGVPWTMSVGKPSIHLALKSGNFGGPDFFTKSFEVLG